MTLQHDMTRVQTLKSLGETFRSAGIDTAQRDARLLLLNAAGISHLDLIQSPRETLGHEVAEKLSDQIARRLKREPVARILGEWEFWSLPFTLSPATLVPRPDSETVVAAALIALKERRQGGHGVRVLDLGTGSGCLLVALLHEMPGATGVGAHDIDAQIAINGVIASTRDPVEFATQPAPDTVVIVVGNLGVEDFIKTLDVGRGHHTPLVFAFGDDSVFVVFVILVVDRTDDLFEHVFHRDDAEALALFVSDNRHMGAAALKQPHELILPEIGAYEDGRTRLRPEGFI